jgi:hypothetical protein
MVLDYIEGRPVLVLPNRFRIIATVNEYDTRFVNSMSAALRRRFAKVTILPPSNDSIGRSPVAEFETAMAAAAGRASAALGTSVATELLDAVAARGEKVREIFGLFRRSTGDGIPLGTAQLIDVVAYFLVFASKADHPTASYATGAGDPLFWSLFDRSLVARLVPALETDSTRARLEPSFAVEFAKAFPDLPRTAARLGAFLHGRD